MEAGCSDRLRLYVPAGAQHIITNGGDASSHPARWYPAQPQASIHVLAECRRGRPDTPIIARLVGSSHSASTVVHCSVLLVRVPAFYQKENMLRQFERRCECWLDFLWLVLDDRLHPPYR